jgi:hypothetical protein
MAVRDSLRVEFLVETAKQDVQCRSRYQRLGSLEAGYDVPAWYNWRRMRHTLVISIEPESGH